MGLADKAKSTAGGAMGRARETVGDKTDADSMKTEGKKNQTTSDVKQAGENVKDAFKN